VLKYVQSRRERKHSAWRSVLSSWVSRKGWEFPSYLLSCPGYAGPMRAQVFCPLEGCVWEEERDEGWLTLSNRSFSFGWSSPHTSPIWGMKMHSSHSVNSVSVEVIELLCYWKCTSLCPCNCEWTNVPSIEVTRGKWVKTIWVSWCRHKREK